MILLSIIIPVFNSEKYLIKSMESILKNLEVNYEVIIINDCSHDKSLNILIEYSKKIKNIRLINLKINKGYGNACNIGIEKAQGEYIAFFEPDDILLENFYQDLLKQRSSADIIKYNGIYQFNDDLVNKKKLFQYYNFPEKIFYYNEYFRFWKAHPSIINCIYKKNFIRKNNIKFCKGGDASYQDVQFNVRLYYSKPFIKIINDCKYCYRRHKYQSTHSTTSQKIQEVIKNWNEEQEFEQQINIKNWDYFNLQWYRHFFSLLKKTNIKGYIFITLYLIRDAYNKKVSKKMLNNIKIDNKFIIKYHIIRKISCLIHIF